MDDVGGRGDGGGSVDGDHERPKRRVQVSSPAQSDAFRNAVPATSSFVTLLAFPKLSLPVVEHEKDVCSFFVTDRSGNPAIQVLMELLSDKIEGLQRDSETACRLRCVWEHAWSRAAFQAFPKVVYLPLMRIFRVGSVELDGR